MEMGSLPGDDQNGEQEAQNDIMHFARVGDIPAMEKLFESGGYDATYTDDEGITPLHVRNPVLPYQQQHRAIRACAWAKDHLVAACWLIAQ
jgi:hypothetical protein